MPACDRCAVGAGSVTPGKVRGSGGLAVVGAILLFSGVTSGLVGEALRKNNDATWRLLVLAAGIMAAAGLLCVFARLVLLVVGRFRRRTDLSDAELEWGLDSAEDWLNPIRSGWRQPATEQDRPVQAPPAQPPPGPAPPGQAPPGQAPPGPAPPGQASPAYPSPERQPRQAPAADRQLWPGAGGGWHDGGAHQPGPQQPSPASPDRPGSRSAYPPGPLSPPAARPVPRSSPTEGWRVPPGRLAAPPPGRLASTAWPSGCSIWAAGRLGRPDAVLVRSLSRSCRCRTPDRGVRNSTARKRRETTGAAQPCRRGGGGTPGTARGSRARTTRPPDVNLDGARRVGRHMPAARHPAWPGHRPGSRTGACARAAAGNWPGAPASGTDASTAIRAYHHPGGALRRFTGSASGSQGTPHVSPRQSWS